MRRSSVFLLLLCGCGVGTLEVHEHESEESGADWGTLEQGLTVSCAESSSTGYRSGAPFPVTLITIDGKPVEKRTGNAYAVMALAAERAGVAMRVNSGFRTPQEQQYLYNCYVNCNCNSCNLAAAPGYSNHQSGTALDLNTANSAVLNWLNANGGAYGFRRTVPSEPWHWEYFGGGPGGGPCEAPPPPPPCDRTAGPLTFSCDGPQVGLACLNVNEPSDPHTWNDNYLCTAQPLGLRWSYAGPLEGMTCTNTPEAAESNPGAWADNYFCAPPQSPWRFIWSSAGPLAGKHCVHWNETADPDSWHDNYLCAEPVSAFSNAGFTFSMAGPRDGECVNVDEPSDPDTWSDNFFCGPPGLGLRWSFAGPIAGLRCENVAESAEPLAAAWADNYLCVAETAPVQFHWSSAGPIAGLPCVRWFEHSETSATWLDNWLCVEPLPLTGTAAGPLLPLRTLEPGPGSVEGPALEGVQGGVGCSATASPLPLLLLALGCTRRRHGRRYRL